MLLVIDLKERSLALVLVLKACRSIANTTLETIDHYTRSCIISAHGRPDARKFIVNLHFCGSIDSRLIVNMIMYSVCIWKYQISRATHYKVMKIV
jgi:hypothetical protein